jgi:hypothetical protein
VTVHDSLSGDVRLLCEENILLFHFGYRIGMPLHPFMTNDPALERRFAHLDEVWGIALEADDGIPWRHVAFKLLGLDSTLHT